MKKQEDIVNKYAMLQSGEAVDVGTGGEGAAAKNI